MAFDTKRLIQEVEKKGVLWKAPAEGQKVQELKQKAWEEIGESMFANWTASSQVTRDARSKSLLPKMFISFKSLLARMAELSTDYHSFFRKCSKPFFFV